MGWKTWPYWIRGGIISMLIFTVLFFIIATLGGFAQDNSLLIPLILLVLPLHLIFGSITKSIFYPNYPNVYTAFQAYIFMYVELLLSYFILGCIIGFIVGKIKKYKK